MENHPALVQTRAWVQHAVVGLNLCPFAKAPQVKGLIRYAVCEATQAEDLLAALVQELQHLAATPATELETTLLVHPNVLTEFADYNDFLNVVDALLAELGLEGVLQVASFHPAYRFAGTRATDLANATNRSPHPLLHLIREESIARAISQPEQSERIVDANAATLRALGKAGWAQLQARWASDAQA